MRDSLISTLVYVLGNAIGLLMAVILLPGFRIDVTAFALAVLLFSVLLLLLRPLILKLSRKNMPAIEGGIALVATFVGLFLTSILVSGMHMGGMINWLLATLLVWVGALLAGAILIRRLRPRIRKNG